jgi:inhibitor of cysteine peptidase
MKRTIFVSILLVLVLVVSACGAENNKFDPNQPVDSDKPMPVEPDGGPGGDIDGDKVVATAFVNNAQLLIMESFPVQVALDVSGDLPTPCHEFQYEISSPDAENQIHIEIFSMVEPGQVCIEVLEPFSENISLPVSDLPDGVYTVFVNGELVGEFSYPG